MSSTRHRASVRSFLAQFAATLLRGYRFVVCATWVVVGLSAPVDARAQGLDTQFLRFNDGATCNGPEDLGNARLLAPAIGPNGELTDPGGCRVEVCLPDSFVEHVTFADSEVCAGGVNTAEWDSCTTDYCEPGSPVNYGIMTCERFCTPADVATGRCTPGEDAVMNTGSAFETCPEVAPGAIYVWTSDATPAAAECVVPKCLACGDPSCEQAHVGCNSIDVATGEVTTMAKQSDVLVEGAMRTFALTRRYSSERAKLDSIQELAPETRFIYDGWGSGWYHDFDYVLSYRKDRNEFVLGHPDHEQDIIDGASLAGITDPRLRANLPGAWSASADGDPSNDAILDLEVALVLADGTRLTFLFADTSQVRPGQSVDDVSGQTIGVADPQIYLAGLVGIEFNDDYAVEIAYHGVTAGCDDAAAEFRRCAIRTSDGVVARFEYDGDTISALYFGRHPLTAAVPAASAFTHRTRYSWSPEPREVVRGDFAALPIPDLNLLSAAHYEHLEGGTWITETSEVYRYTATSYHRPDLPDSVYATPEPLSVSLQTEFLPAVPITQYLLHTLVDGTGELVEVHEYTPTGAGAADITPDGVFWVEYFDNGDLNGAASSRVVSHNVSSGDDIEYLVADGRAVEASAQCDGTQSGATYERDGAGLVIAELRDSPSDLAATVRTSYHAPAGSMELIQENHTGSQLTVTGTPYAPTRVTGMGYEAAPGEATVISPVYSALCREAPRLSEPLSCGGDYAPYAPAGVFDATTAELETAVYRDYDTDYDSVFNASPGLRLTQELQRGWSSAAITGSELQFAQSEHLSQILYVPGSDQIESIVDAEGQTLSYSYYAPDDADANRAGQLAAIAWNGTVLMRFVAYDSLGRATEVHDENDVVSVFSYDREGRILTRSTTADGQTRMQSLSYRPDGGLLAVEVSNGASSVLTTRTDYTAPAGTPALSSCEDPTAIGDCAAALGYVGKSSAVQVGVGAAASFSPHERSTVVRNAQGLVAEHVERDETDGGAVFAKTAATYDESGWLVREQKFTDSLTSASHVRDVGHNDLGQPVASTSYRFADPATSTAGNLASATESVEYDALGRVVAIDQQGDITRFAYDLHDNLVRVEAPNGTTTEFLYDDFGRVVLERSPDRGETRYRYDGVGNLVARFDALERLTSYAYDDRHRLTAVDFDDDGTAGDPDLVYHYDDWSGVTLAAGAYSCPDGRSFDFVPTHTAGRMSYAEHSVGRTYYAYTAFGEVRWSFVERGTVSDPCDLEVTGYTYDFAGRVSSIQYPSGRIVHYRYTTSTGDETLYAARIELEEGGVVTPLVDAIEYAPGGRIRSYVAGEVSMNASWDYAGQLEQLLYTKTSDGTPLFDWSITARDGNGNIERVGDTVLAQEYLNVYDERDRLASSVGTNLAGNQACGWTYDGAGNRLSETCYGKTLTYDYEPGTNKLQEIRRTAGWGAPPVQPGSGQQYNVDAAGRSGSAHKDLHGTAEGFDMVYGDFDRLTGVDLDRDGTVDVEYRYDHRQLRLSAASSSKQQQYTFRSEGRLISHRDNDNLVEYVWLGHLPVIMSRGGGSESALGFTHIGDFRRAW
ncbi:MAG: hypothetical protein AAFQ65_13195, partial [Myxococcota bacterium]